MADNFLRRCLGWGVCVLSLGPTTNGVSQPVTRWEVPVQVEGRLLRNAWAGGLNQAQASASDLDGDGVAELLLHDRADGQVLVFRRELGIDWRWWPEGTTPLPRGRPGGWYLLRDANRDGRADVVLDTNFGLRVYLRRDARYDLAYPQVRYRDAGGISRSVYISPGDVPGIADVDQDGDLDVLAWDVLGLRVFFHRNAAVERLGRTDTLVLELPSQCWGDFEETFDGSNPFGGYGVRLGLSDCDLPLPPVAPKHGGGSALLPIELTGDNRTDLLITDFGIAYPLALLNGGTVGQARFTAVEGPWPVGQPLDVPASPALFQVDADADGVLDLLVSPNETFASADSTSLWWYRNLAASGPPVFRLQEAGFLQHTMLDFGTSAQPAVADLDGDGRLDLLVGVQQSFALGSTATGQRAARLAWLRNTGTSTQPELTLTQRDFLGFQATPRLRNLIWLAPAAGDLDADGWTDLLIGAFDLSLSRPRLLYARRNAQGEFQILDEDYLDFSTQLVSGLAPHLADVDQDGDLDLLVGTAQGDLQHWENTGSATVPRFEWRTNTFGGIRLTSPTASDPRLRPAVVDLGRDGVLELLIGSSDGSLRVFRMEGTTFPELAPLAGVGVGASSAPAVGSWLGPGNDLALVVGTERGGMELFRLANTGLPPAPEPRVSVDLYPNPGSTLVTVRAPAQSPVVVYDLVGRRVAQGRVPADGRWPLDVSEWASGVYLVAVDTPGGRQTRKLVVQ